MVDVYKLTCVICMMMWSILLVILLHDYSIARRVGVPFPSSLSFLIGCCVFEILTKFFSMVPIG